VSATGSNDETTAPAAHESSPSRMRQKPRSRRLIGALRPSALLGRSRWLLGVVSGAFTVAAVGVVIWTLASGGSDPQRGSAVAPGEYLYLDNDRVRAYLGQIEFGLSQTEERRVTQTDKTEVGLNVPQASVAGTTQRDTYVRRVVTPRAADRFYSLRNRLEDRGWLHHLDAARPRAFHRAVADLRTGDFVEIAGAQLRIPSFAAVFAKANYADQLVAPGQRRVPGRLLGPISRQTRAALADYIRHVGKDPRLPFRMTVPPGERRHVRILLPLRASRLGYQPGLASGTVRVVAKVVRALQPPPADASSQQRRAARYLDVETFHSFGRALQQASPAVLQRLDIKRDTPRLGIRAIVTRAARVIGPGLVLLPIAVFA
jgi:hypothetical protein